jgi:hypothetical protein
VKEPIDILREARALIEDPEDWTRGAYARDAEGQDVESLAAPYVDCRCAVGALRTAAGIGTTGRTPAFESALTVLRIAAGGDRHAEGESPVLDLNDGGLTVSPGRKPRPAPARHRRVMRMYDRAIAEMEAG